MFYYLYFLIILYYSEKVLLSSGGTHAVVKDSDGFHIVGGVVASSVALPAANETYFWKIDKLE